VAHRLQVLVRLVRRLNFIYNIFAVKKKKGFDVMGREQIVSMIRS
jgi:hypothetical protein